MEEKILAFRSRYHINLTKSKNHLLPHQEKMTREIKVSYEDLQKKCITLAEQIIHSGFKPDIVVSITRGGLLSAYFLADLIGVKSIEMINIESKDG